MHNNKVKIKGTFANHITYSYIKAFGYSVKTLVILWVLLATRNISNASGTHNTIIVSQIFFQLHTIKFKKIFLFSNFSPKVCFVTRNVVLALESIFTTRYKFTFLLTLLILKSCSVSMTSTVGRVVGVSVEEQNWRRSCNPLLKVVLGAFKAVFDFGTAKIGGTELRWILLCFGMYDGRDKAQFIVASNAPYNLS